MTAASLSPEDKGRSRPAVEEIVRYCEQNMCWHCGRLPDADGDHSCPCPYSDGECPEHTSDEASGAER